MMNQNLFLASPSCQPSERWREAFPAGVSVSALELERMSIADSVVWLPSTDAHWQAGLEALVRAHPAAAVIVVSDMPDDNEALRALELGARGYCHARAVPSLLREAGLAVEHGGLWVGPALLARFVGALRQHVTAARPAPAPAAQLRALLSAREFEVAQAVAGGASNKEAAARLGISERTVKAHLSAVFEKLAVRDRMQLALRMATGANAESGEKRGLHQV